MFLPVPSDYKQDKLCRDMVCQQCRCRLYDAYKYRITKDMFAGGGTKNHMGKEIRIRKADFEK